MRIAARFVYCAALLTMLASPLFAQNNGPAASGGFHFTAGEHPFNIEFHASSKGNGPTDGKIKMSGTVDMPDQDVDGEGIFSGGSTVDVSFEVEVDCLTVDGNRAVVGGEIEDASIPEYVGRRVLLAVVDGGEGKNAGPDQFLWGVYGGPPFTWVASDAELEVDTGVGLTWFATDFEREDDVGIPSHSDATITCTSFPAAAYALVDLPQGTGNIQVKP